MNNYSPTANIQGEDVIISGVKNFNLNQTFDCGQAFRWKEIDQHSWCGIAFGRYLKVSHINGNIILHNTTLDEYEKIWRKYFDIDRDYSEIIELISSNKILKTAAESNSGIRILKQEPWEALCSFIISQNNNIPRIKGIIERLCQCFGNKIDGGYTFPSAKTIAKLSTEDLAPIRSGFRAKYIIDAAIKYSNGHIDLSVIENSDTDTARAELMKIKGVGNKVADCTLLFGFSRIEVLPKDVWIKRALETYFNGSFPKCANNYAGIAQQYLFNYIRNLNYTNK